VQPYKSEIEVRDALGIASWRNLSKDVFLGFLERLPEVDPQVALQIIAQIPEITKLARAAVGDAAKAYDAALKTNTRGQEIVHEIELERLKILKSELDKDLTPEAWGRVLDEIRDVHAKALLHDTDNKKFISEQLDKTLAAAGVAVAAVAAVVFAAVRSGQKPTLAAGRILGS
jgi:hypothetical protein